MGVSRTRTKLIDVARQLFAKMGVGNTTMNDIARESMKGRRTLYTYFKSKEEVYMAVVQTELRILSDKMREVVARDISPDKKIMEMIFTKLGLIKSIVMRNGSLKADFFNDIRKVKAARKQFDKVEIGLFKSVLEEGIEKGVFNVDNTELVAQLMHYCIKGIEVPYILGRIGPQMTDAERNKYIERLIFGALQRKE